MDPQNWRRHGNRHGLPRLRGDGPEIMRAELVRRLAPPPTRGWTLRRWSGCCSYVGSPPTRGWTPAAGGRLGWRQGSPAYAGMDPKVLRPPGLRARLPRPRGDDPSVLRSGKKGAGLPRPRGDEPEYAASYRTPIEAPSVHQSPATHPQSARCSPLLAAFDLADVFGNTVVAM